MATETHTGRLIFGDGEVNMEDGTVLAVQGSPTPCATAAGRYAKFGQTQPVTVTGNTGIVDNAPVLFVTNIQWAAAASASGVAATGNFSGGGGVQSVPDAEIAPPAQTTTAKPAATKIAPKKAAAKKNSKESG